MSSTKNRRNDLLNQLSAQDRQKEAGNPRPSMAAEKGSKDGIITIHAMSESKQEIAEQIVRGLNEELQKELAGHDFLPVESVPILFSTRPEAKIVTEDVHRLWTTTHYTYYSWGHSYCTTEDEKRLPEIPDASWHLCMESEAKHLNHDLHWKDWGMVTRHPYYDNGNSYPPISGVTLAGRESYYVFTNQGAKKFDGSEQKFVSDLYVITLPKKKTSLEWLFDHHYLPMSEKRHAFWKLLHDLYTHKINGKGILQFTVRDGKYKLKCTHGCRHLKSCRTYPKVVSCKNPSMWTSEKLTCYDETVSTYKARYSHHGYKMFY